MGALPEPAEHARERPPSGRIVLNGPLVKTLGIKLPATLQRRAETVE